MSTAFDQILKDVKACSVCEADLPHAPRPVLQIHPQAKILIAGQAPGIKAHLAGKPFDDQSGDRLRDWLGIDKQQFYDASKVAILPMGFCFPGTGRSGDLAPRPECAKKWRADLLALMPNIAFTIVIGQYAHTYYYPQIKQTLTEAVKAWSEDWPRQIVLPHPSPRNNIWLKRNPWFEQTVLPSLRARINEVYAKNLSK